MQYSIFT